VYIKYIDACLCELTPLYIGRNTNNSWYPTTPLLNRHDPGFECR